MAKKAKKSGTKLDITKYNPQIDNLREVRYEIESFIFERERLIKAAIITLLAREHMLLIGPPGTAKSMIIHQLTKRITGVNLFEILMHPMITDKDLFVSRTEIQESIINGVKSFRTAYFSDGNTLANAQFAFLDEIYKANYKTLNSLLTLLNERKYDLNKERFDAPLLSGFFASNEMPEVDGSDGLAAFHDRLLIRAIVPPVKERENQVNVIKTQLSRRDAKVRGIVKSEKTIDIKDLETLQSIVPLVYVPEEVINKVLDLADKVQQDLDIYISQRRIEKATKLMQAKAVLGKRDTVKLTDLNICRYIFWTEEENYPKVDQIIKNMVYTPEQRRLKEIKEQTFELYRLAKKKIDDGNLWNEDLDEYITGMKDSIQELNGLSTKTTSVELKKEITTLTEEVFDHMKEIAILDQSNNSSGSRHNHGYNDGDF